MINYRLQSNEIYAQMIQQFHIYFGVRVITNLQQP